MSNASDQSNDGREFWAICYVYANEIRMNTEFPSKLYYINYIIGVIFNIFLLILTIFLNSMTILAYMRSALLKNKSSYFLIVLLSVNDLLVGLFGNTSFTLVLLAIINGSARCEFFIAFEFATFLTAGMSTDGSNKKSTKYEDD